VQVLMVPVAAAVAVQELIGKAELVVVQVY
jgi:hypothetical protein